MGRASRKKREFHSEFVKHKQSLFLERLLLSPHVEEKYKSLLSKTICIDIQNVYKYLYDRETLQWNKDIPNITPPFDNFFLEWNEGPKVDEARIGVCILNVKLDENIGFTRFLYGDLLEELNVLEEDIKWIWWAQIFMEHSSNTVGPLIECFVPVDAQGKLVIALPAKWKVPKQVQMLPEIEAILFSGDDENERERQNHIILCALAISFMHCKNIILEQKSQKRYVKYKERTKEVRQYTLNIEPMKQVLRTEGKSEETGLRKALHICRGHFSTYTEEKKLFGKHTGTFWIPQHVRGSSDHGIVEKDYNIMV